MLFSATLTGEEGWELELREGDTEMWIVIPEPATMSLLAVGAVALLRRRRRA